MCGICGIYNFGNTPTQDEIKNLIRMRDEMVHRGPDDCGEWVSGDGRVLLGHRRLSIIDLSEAGHQPMSNEDGSVWVSFNGEIYNHMELGKTLKSAGHAYRSRADTEAIVHGYEEWGAGVVDRLEGMFAFALYDAKKRVLYLTRDRLGKKPLYYTIMGDKLIFASEIKAILTYPGVHRDIDEEAFYRYLNFTYTPAPMTMFKDIYKLPAASILTFDNGGLKQSRIFWSAAGFKGDKVIYKESLYVDKLRQLLKNAVRKRMMADVPYGVFLSGGLDSSCNVALMSEVSPSRVNTFNIKIAYGNKLYEEDLYARAVAKHFNTNHAEISISETDFLNFFEKMVYHQDEPLADSVCVPNYYLSKLARDNGVIVLLAGEGSDEIFCGYRHYLCYYHLQLMEKAAPFGLLRKIRRFDRMLRQVSFFPSQIGFNDAAKNGIISKEMAQNFNTRATEDHILSYYARYRDICGRKNYLGEVAYLELNNRLAELILMRLDKMGMANSVEIRAPFLDHALVEFAMSLPDHMKIKWMQGKYILKKAMEGVLPTNIIYRKKVGFGGGADNMLTPGIARYAQDLITLELKSKGIGRYLDLNGVQNLFWAHSNQKRQSSEIWTLLNFGIWYKRWISG